MEHLPVRKNIRLNSNAYRRGNVFFITIATHKRMDWFRRFPLAAEGLQNLILKLSKERETTIYAWCIMPNHLHLLLKDHDISNFVRRLKGHMTSKARKFLMGQRLWQKSYYDHGLRSDESLQAAARYIWQNPVRKGMVDHPSIYRWSGSIEWPEWLAME